MNYRDPKSSKGQVERLARHYYKKMAHIFGASLTADDLCQEFWLVWNTAWQRFDPGKGYDFQAFLGVAIRNKAFELMRHHRRRMNTRAHSADTPVGDSELTLADLAVDEEESVEVRVIKRQERERILEKVDPRLRKIITLLENPPDQLQAQIEALKAKAAHAESLGLSMREPKDLTLNVVSEVVGVSRCVRYKMLEDMMRIIENE